MSVTREKITFKQLQSMVDQLESLGVIISKDQLGEGVITYAKTPNGKTIFKAIVKEIDDISASWVEGLFDKN